MSSDPCNPTFWSGFYSGSLGIFFSCPYIAKALAYPDFQVNSMRIYNISVTEHGVSIPIWVLELFVSNSGRDKGLEPDCQSAKLLSTLFSSSDAFYVARLS